MTKKTSIKSATDFIRAVAKDPGSYPENFISLPMDPDLIASVLSRERTRLVQYLLKHGPTGSVHALADALDRNYASVSRDLGVLIDMGLVASEKHGKNKELRATGRPVLITTDGATGPATSKGTAKANALRAGVIPKSAGRSPIDPLSAKRIWEKHA